MGYRVLGQGLGVWIVQGSGGRTMSRLVPSPSPAHLLQTKNMDYYKREVSGVRGGSSSGEARATRHPNISRAPGPRSSTAGRPWPGPG